MEECLENPKTTEEEIMAATYRALTKHGYSQLSIQNIADEFEKSKSLLYHHYSGKDEILFDFLDHMINSFEQEICMEKVENPREDLENILFEPLSYFSEEEDQDFMNALTELRIQAVRDDSYREKVNQNADFFTENIREVLEEGQEQGVFQEKIDPETVALFLFTAVSGALTMKSTTGREPEFVKKELENYLESQVYR